MHDPTVAHLLPEGVRTGVHPAEAFGLQHLARGKTVLEFGAQLGFSTIVMGLVADQVVSVDWHHGDDHAGWNETLAPYIENITRYGLRDRIVTIVARFEQAAPFLSPSFQVGFIDGFHDYASTRRDLDLMAPLVDETMAVHDYDRALGDEEFETKRAVDDWLGEHPDWRVAYFIQSLVVLQR